MVPLPAPFCVISPPKCHAGAPSRFNLNTWHSLASLFFEWLRWFTGSVRQSEEQPSLMFYQVAHSAHHFLFLSHCLPPIDPPLLSSPIMSLFTESMPLSRRITHVKRLSLAAPTSSTAMCLRISFSGWVLSLKHCPHWPCGVCVRGITLRNAHFSRWSYWCRISRFLLTLTAVTTEVSRLLPVEVWSIVLVRLSGSLGAPI